MAVTSRSIALALIAGYLRLSAIIWLPREADVNLYRDLGDFAVLGVASIGPSTIVRLRRADLCS